MIRSRVDYEDFVIPPGGSIDVYYDYRARRLQEIYPWLILEQIIIEKNSEEQNEVKIQEEKIVIPVEEEIQQEDFPELPEEDKE